MYLEAAFQDLGAKRLPVAQELGATSLMFEVHPTLDPERLAGRAERVAKLVRSALQ